MRSELKGLLMEMDMLLSTIFTMRVSSRSLFSLSRALCIRVRGSQSQACVIMPRGARVSAGFQPRAITVVTTAKIKLTAAFAGANTCKPSSSPAESHREYMLRRLSHAFLRNMTPTTP